MGFGHSGAGFRRVRMFPRELYQKRLVIVQAKSAAESKIYMPPTYPHIENLKTQPSTSTTKPPPSSPNRTLPSFIPPPQQPPTMLHYCTEGNRGRSTRYPLSWSTSNPLVWVRLNKRRQSAMPPKHRKQSALFHVRRPPPSVDQRAPSNIGQAPIASRWLQ